MYNAPTNPQGLTLSAMPLRPVELAIVQSTSYQAAAVLECHHYRQ